VCFRSKNAVARRQAQLVDNGSEDGRARQQALATLGRLDLVPRDQAARRLARFWQPPDGRGGKVTDAGRGVTNESPVSVWTMRSTPAVRGCRPIRGIDNALGMPGEPLENTWENYQPADGSVIIPGVLRPWVGKERIAARG
jgi:hypothetical protein